MMNYIEAVNEFGINFANMMCETEYNEFIRGISFHKTNPVYEIEFGAEEDPFFEELYRMEEEF